MKTRSMALLKEELEVLVLAAKLSDGNHLSNSEISQYLDIPVSRVKTIIHQVCDKLGVSNRNEAIHYAMVQGDIKITDVYSLDELADLLRSLSPNNLRKIAKLMFQKLESRYLMDLENDEPITRTNISQNVKLSQTEREVLILVGRRLTNKEIADRLYISFGSVGVILRRIFIKLGAYKRADAVVLGLKQGEIGINEILSLSELMEFLFPIGTENIEKVAQLMEQKVGQPLIPTGSQ